MDRTELDPQVYHFLESYYGKQDLDAILQALVTPPSFTTLRVNTLKITREELAQKLSEYLRSHGEPHEVLLHPDMEDVITIPASGPHAVENIYPQVAIDAKCGQAVLMGSDIFVPGVMGAESGINSGDIVSVVVDLDNSLLRGDHRKLTGRAFFVGNGIAQMGRSVIFRGNSGIAVKMKSRIWHHPPLNNVFPDLLFLQHLPSIIVSHQLNPQPNQLVLDMCAAPGGKTLHIATLMQNRGKLFAFDKSRSKVQQIRDLAERHNINIITALHRDSTKLMQIHQLHGLADSQDLSPHFEPESFDSILLDPPCSGLGQRPRLKESISLVNVKSASQYQQKLLSVAYQLLKIGGTLVYSTCTLNPEENEGNVKYALSSFPGLRLVKQGPPYLGHIGLDAFGLSKEQRECVQRFSPSGSLNTIGFFIAKFTKVNEVPET